jgi:betaine-aldehyde dehydrogenase
MAVWKIGPALAAGNSVVLKPATRTPLTTIRLAELALEAGIPAGVLNVVTGPGPEVGAAIAAHEDVDLVSLTGDSDTGKHVTALAAGNLKRVHLELGGKAPFIVYADADLEAASRGATAGGFINAGQDCTAATRLYVQRSAHDEFIDRLATLVSSIRVGDPRLLTTDMGSLISTEQVERVHGFVERARAAGGRVICGGQLASVWASKVALYEPTVIADVDQGGASTRFGPASSCCPSTWRPRFSAWPMTR